MGLIAFLPAELEADARDMIKTGKPLKMPALKALLRGWNQPLSEILPGGKQHVFKKKELLEKVKAQAELRFALDLKQSESDEPSPKRRRCRAVELSE